MRERRNNICVCVFMLLYCMACNNANSPSNPAKIYSDTTYKMTNPQNTSRGKELFEAKCIACHGVDGNYKNNNAADLSVTVIDSISIINIIKNGKGAMPMFGSLFPDPDLAQIELYVKTLRK